ncbi:MAG: helix-turn-helix domain-containing protein [Oscillospiraceae bacterium]|nr:helix-turn-helix domain-containing protein [Oscillospiraceae bacterium]
MSVGKMIKQALEIRGMSQTELAAKVSIPLSTLNGYIMGKHEPSVSKMRAIADVLEVSMNYLLEIDEVNTLSEDELYLILTYRTLDEVKQRAVLRYVKGVGLW